MSRPTCPTNSASPARAPFPILFSVASTLSPVNPTPARISRHRLKCESYGSSIDGCAINRSNHQAPIALPVASPARQPASGRSARALTVPSFASLSVAEWATCQWTQALTSRRSHAGERRVDKLGRHGRSQEPRLGRFGCICPTFIIMMAPACSGMSVCIE